VSHDIHRTGNVATRLGGIDQPPELTIVSPAAGSVHNEGDAVVFQASALDAEDGDLSNAVSWTSSLDGALGVGAQLSIDTLTVGHHVITASVSDAGGQSVARTVEIDIAQGSTLVNLTTDLDSPQRVGTQVTLTATVDGGVSGYEFRFRVRGDATGGVWVVLNDFSPQSTWVWDTSAYTGSDRLQVSVRTAGATNGPYIHSGMNFTINAAGAAEAVTLTADPVSPQTVGQVVILSAAASGGTGPYEYRFEARSVTADGDWQALQDFAAASNATWNTSGWLGQNRIRVLARRAGTLDEPVKQGDAYWVNTPGAICVVDLTLTPGGTQPSGTPILLTAQALDGVGPPEYQFQLRGPSTNGAWAVVRDFAQQATYSWDTSGLVGDYRLRVLARNAGTDDQPVSRGRNLTLE